MKNRENVNRIKKEYIVKRNLDSIKKDSENIEIFFKKNKAKRIII